jgi:hypothetical protein
MAYASGSLNVVQPRLGGGDDAGSLACAVWSYRSADVAATVIAAGYIDDGADKGMKVGDIVMVADDTTPLATLRIVSVVDVSTNPAGDVTLV